MSYAVGGDQHSEFAGGPAPAPDKIRLLVATPLGKRGRGGIDRLNDGIFDAIGRRPELNISAKRLVTRGQRSLLTAQFIFALALISLCFAALRRDVDLLHIHLSDRGSAYRKTVLGDIARLLRVPYVVHLHGAIFVQFWSATSPGLSRAIGRLFRESNHIVVMGQYWARAIVERVPTAAPKISIVPNATMASGLDQLPSETGRVRITCLGQLGQRKGTSQLIDAFQRLNCRDDWTATVAGDGMVQDYRAKVCSLGMQDKVAIPGWLDSAATEDLLRRTDILVLPSFSENLPMVILEAFAHGIPVISTPVGAIPEVVREGHNGLLVPAGDVAALARALERLIEDPALRRNLGSEARRDHAERYDIGPYIARLAEIWRRSVAR
jgi:glycosyltransferase involved in cell wall biosynthesis